MNKLKIIISYILVILLIPLNVKASGSSGSIDVGFSLDGTYGDGNQYEAYTYKPSDSNLPSGFHYYYKFSDGHVGTYSRDEVVSDILSHKIGIVMSPTRLATFITGYSSWLSQDPNYYNVLKPVLKNDALVGVALNGLTGGTIESSAPSGNVSIPSSEVNNVYNYYNLWINSDGFIAPDYINIQGEANTYFSQRIDQTLNETQVNRATNTLANISIGFSYSNYGSLTYNKTDNVVRTTNTSNCSMLSLPENSCLVGLTNNLCVALGLSANNDTITWAQLLTKEFNGDSVTCYDKETYTQKKFNTVNQNGVSQASNYSQTFAGGNATNTGLFIGNITLYRDVNVVQAIKNNTYYAPEYKTTNYNNFNVDNNNTYEAPSNQIQNSVTDNSTVYNQTNTSNNTNITNQIDNSDNSYSYVDNSQIITNTTTIVNTYYENNYGTGGGGNDNPDNPDNPSGGGGSDLEDDTILDALLAAILKLLRAIGKIIATILTGIIEIITDVLTAITNITTSFTGIIEFIGSIFGFLPSECIAVLTLGLTISVLIALLKMFGK